MFINGLLNANFPVRSWHTCSTYPYNALLKTTEFEQPCQQLLSKYISFEMFLRILKKKFFKENMENGKFQNVLSQTILILKWSLICKNCTDQKYTKYNITTGIMVCELFVSV